MSETEATEASTKDTPLPKTSKQVQLKPGEGFLDDSGRKCLEEVDLLKIELLRVKAEEQKQIGMKLHLNATQVEFNSNLTVRAMRNDAMAAEREAVEFKRAQEKLFIELGPKYGVDFKAATYDDETGIITIFEETKKSNESDIKKAPDETVN